MSEQIGLAFELPPRPVHPAHPIAIMRPDHGCIRVEWPELRMRPVFFNSWPHALDCVLHNVNEHVRILVRP